MHVAILVAVWFIWRPARLELWLSLAYVLSVWMVAEGILLGVYVAFSLAPFPDLLVTSLRASAIAMWFVPGVLLLASRSRGWKFVGLSIVVNCARLLAASRAPRGPAWPSRRSVRKRSEPLLFRYQPKQVGYLSWETAPTIFSALTLQLGVYSLAGEYPLLAAASFAASIGIWAATSVAQGGFEARTGEKRPFLGPGVIVTMLLCVALTAVLIQVEIVQETPARDRISEEFLKSPALTTQVWGRLAHVPPAPVAPGTVKAAVKPVVTRLADPGPARGEKKGNGFPGVLLRPLPKARKRPLLIAPWAHFQISAEGATGIPFTGEYQLFRRSSGSLPAGAVVQTGTPLDGIYGTTNGGPMDTVALQPFDPPIDLSHCGLVSVVLTSVESLPALALMQFVGEGWVEDGSTELMGMNQNREETLEFQAPVVAKPLLVHAIRILFRRPGKDGDKNVRVAVQRFTFVPRGLPY